MYFHSKCKKINEKPTNIIKYIYIHGTYTQCISFHSKCNRFIEKLAKSINIYEINTKCIHTFHTKYNKIIGTLTTNIWKFITIQRYSMEKLCIYKKCIQVNTFPWNLLKNNKNHQIHMIIYIFFPSKMY